MEVNKIYTGDCIDVLTNNITNNTINLVFADPPYNLSGKGLKWGIIYNDNQGWFGIISGL